MWKVNSEGGGDRSISGDRRLWTSHFEGEGQEPFGKLYIVDCKSEGLHKHLQMVSEDADDADRD